LAASGLDPKVVDIDQDPSLQAIYNEWVPVVEINGRVRFRGHVDPVLLRRVIIAEQKAAS
jgi:hypothetical protein